MKSSMISQKKPERKTTVKRQKLPEQLVEFIEKMILSGEYQQGDRLPSERDLAEQFDVSRATVREATNQLERQGLVNKRVGLGGTIVSRSISPTTVSESIRKYFLFNSFSPEDVTDFRSAMEPEIAAMAAHNATREDLAQLEDALHALENYFNAGKIEYLTEADVKFHEMLASASNNELMRAVCSGMHLVLKDGLELLNPIHDVQARKRGIYAHREIYEAVAKGDAERARELMRDHIDFGHNALMESWEKMVSEKE